MGRPSPLHFHPEAPLARTDESAARAPRSARTDKLWEDVAIDPVEIALPAGVGYTLRAYRLDTEIKGTEVERDEDIYAQHKGRRFEDQDVEAMDDVLDEEDLDDEDLDDEADFDDDDDESDEDELEDEEDSDDEDSDGDDEEAAVQPEEVPIFLSHKGRLLMFRSPEGLAAFIKSDEPHDLAQLSTWKTLRDKVRAADIQADDEDTYELDLVVATLRGPVDGWDRPLIVKAGESARDLSYALRLDSVTEMLAVGSPLDDLDEAVRTAEAGGLSGFLAQRRLRKIGVQQASLGWRTIIGKISAVVDWRD
jgi:hypothetical protein